MDNPLLTHLSQFAQLTVSGKDILQEVVTFLQQAIEVDIVGVCSRLNWEDNVKLIASCSPYRSVITKPSAAACVISDQTAPKAAVDQRSGSQASNSRPQIQIFSYLQIPVAHQKLTTRTICKKQQSYS